MGLSHLKFISCTIVQLHYQPLYMHDHWLD